MSSLKEQLISSQPPQPKEVWLVKDDEITLHSDNRVQKKARPVLVVSNKNLARPNSSIINIIPLTTSKKPDKLIFPIAQAYEETCSDFQPKNASCALVQFYQPIELKYFKKRCGHIELNSYNAIQYILCTEVIGYCEFDLNID